MSNKLEFNKNNFLKFLNLCSINSSDKEIGINELLVNIKPKQMYTRGNNSTKSIAYEGNMLGDFPELGEVGIDNISILKNFVTSVVSDTCTMKKTENKLTTELSNVKFSASLRNPKFITSCPPKEKYDNFKQNALGNEFTIKSDDVKKILQYFKAVGANTFTFSGIDKSVQVHMSNQDNEVTVTLDIEKPITEFKNVRIGKLLNDVLLNLAEYDLVFSIKNDSPVYIKVSNKEINFEYIIAPLVSKK